MQVIVDTREQVPWSFEHDPSISIVRAHLDAGDYSVRGFETRIAIERKSLDDWVGTVMRERTRFYRELELLRGFEFRCVIIEAGVRQITEKSYRSNASPASVLGFVSEVFVAQSVPVLLGGTRADSQILAASLLRMAAKKLQTTG